MVSGPGSAEKLCIYEVEESRHSLVEFYENPGLKAPRARGVVAVASAINKGASALIVSEIGPHPLQTASGRAKIYLATGMRVEEALQKLAQGELPRGKGANPR